MLRTPVLCLSPIVLSLLTPGHVTAQRIGQEIAVPRHLQDGDEFRIDRSDLLAHGRLLMTAVWTSQEGAGRPLTKGTGAPISDPTDPLVFPRAFNRISARDSNGCAGCHNAPFGQPGGGGDFVTGVFVLGQRFDFATFDASDPIPTKGSMQENGLPATMQSIADFRATIGMFGSGYIELLAREMTADLQRIRDAIPAGGSMPLVTKGVSFGTLSRGANGSWITTQVEGLSRPSVATTGPGDPPNLLIRPFHQSGSVVSLREFTNNAYNHHHGIQSEERFGIGQDPDGDGFVNELTRADVTAVTVFQAVMAVPGRVIPRDRQIEQAVWRGEQLFDSIGCATCHVSSLPLASSRFVEPDPYNPPGNLQSGTVPDYVVDLNDRDLPGPRLQSHHGITDVPAYTDLKLHDICAGPDDPNVEPLNQQAPAGSPDFFAGNRYFLTKKLWGAANEPPYFHHGQFTTLREATLAHDGEARTQKLAYQALTGFEQDCVIEFLKSLQELPPGTRSLVVDERGNPREWPPENGGGHGGGNHGHGHGHGRDDRH